MNIFDKIIDPLKNNANLEYLIKLCSVLNENQNLNFLYNYLVQEEKSLSDTERIKYCDNFFKYIVEPFAKEMEENLKKDNTMQLDDSYESLYLKEDFIQMFKEKTSTQIINEGRKIESKNPVVFDKLNDVFYNYGDDKRIGLYEQFLREHNVNLTPKEFWDWVDYRAIIESFQNPRSMGFYGGTGLEDSEKLKLYINAGENTYELAKIFDDECKKNDINLQFKVAIGNVPVEVGRKDKMCIYIDDLKKLEPVLEILENIKETRKDFNFKTPMKSVGQIDNWIGIGSDLEGFSSYNNEFSGVLIDVYQKSFGNMSANQVQECIRKNPKVLNDFKNEIAMEMQSHGRSGEKVCVLQKDVYDLKSINVKQKSQNQNFTTNNIIKIVQDLYNQNYNGEIKNPAVKLAYKLYCDNKLKQIQIQKNDEIIKFDKQAIENLYETNKKIVFTKAELNTKIEELGSKVKMIRSKINDLGIEIENQKNTFSKNNHLKSIESCTDIINDCKEFIDPIRRLDKDVDICINTEKAKYKIMNARMNFVDSRKDNGAISNNSRRYENSKTNVDIYDITNSMDENNITEEKLEILYQNKYNGNFKNSAIKQIYNLYCESKLRDNKLDIQNNIIGDDEKVFENLLNMNITEVIDLKSKNEIFVKNGNQIALIIEKVQNLQKELGQENAKSFLGKLTSKSKNSMQEFENSCLNIISDCDQISRNLEFLKNNNIVVTTNENENKNRIKAKILSLENYINPNRNEQRAKAQESPLK